MDRQPIARALEIALTGRHAHPDPVEVLQAIDATTAARRPPGAPHGIAELVGHLVFWLEVGLDWLGGIEPPDTRPEASWPVPPGPIPDEEWDAWRRRFAEGLAAMRKIAAGGDLEAELSGVPDVRSLDALLVQAAHQSWHLGQVMLLAKLAASKSD